MQPVLTLKSDKTTAQLKAEAGEEGTVTVKPPLTLAGWSLVEQAASCPDVVLESADGDTFIGSVEDVDEGKYEIYVELR